MKVVILAGGQGTRISEYTKKIPKPMIQILKKPIIVRIIEYYSKFNFKEFIIAGGYKQQILKSFFKKNLKDLNIKVVNTGTNTMTGGRLKRLKKFLNRETFLMTYGDGLANVDLDKLIKFHKKNKKLVTLTAVRPPARFGYLKLKGNSVKYFKEKSKTDEGWINGGFFIIEPKFLNNIKGDGTYLEREPLEKLVKKNNLAAFKHKGFWQCVDTVRDKNNLENLLKQNKYKKIFD
tara:strand:- start:428 stop:1129 length:702 start_codon:yes stop_codon:yes gene_type:complete